MDAKTYSGAVERRVVGPMWREENRLYVGRRNRTKLAEGMTGQVKAVRAALEVVEAPADLQVRAALCFLDSEWPLLLRPFDVNGVTVIHPKALRTLVSTRKLFALRGTKPVEAHEPANE